MKNGDVSTMVYSTKYFLHKTRQSITISIDTFQSTTIVRHNRLPCGCRKVVCCDGRTRGTGAGARGTGGTWEMLEVLVGK